MDLQEVIKLTLLSCNNFIREADEMLTSKKTVIFTFAIVFFSCILMTLSCAYTVSVQPHISPVVVPKLIGDEAGIYISPNELQKVHKQSSFFGGKIRVPLGSPLKESTQESFAPFFKRVFFVGSSDPTMAPFIIETRLVDFSVTGGLDTRLTIECKVNKEGQTVFLGNFEGRGSGTAAAGFVAAAFAREEIVKSAESAFKDAFLKIQNSFKEEMFK
ncbi:MAG: hypothetical protein V1794_10055 [Candidatus Glassbacteria bacterium]